MKKTLVALAVTAFAASASAVTVYNENGTNVDLYGSLRVHVEDASSSTKNAQGVKTKSSNQTNLKNAGTRFGLQVKHNLNDDGFYAIGRMEFRLDGVDKDGKSSRDKFSKFYTKRAYVGLGQKDLGQIAFGRQATIADDFGINKNYAYDLTDGYIETDGAAVIRYDYEAIEGLKLSANYNFGQSETIKGQALTGSDVIKNGYAVGAMYETQVADNNTLFLNAGYGRTNYETGTVSNRRLDGYQFDIGYKIDRLKFGVETGYSFDKDSASRTKSFYIDPSIQYQVTDKSSVYGAYIYEHTKSTVDHIDDGKTKKHGFQAGVDYKFHKQVVAYVEGKYIRTKSYDENNEYEKKSVDKAIAVGMRVYW